MRKKQSRPATRRGHRFPLYLSERQHAALLRASNQYGTTLSEIFRRGADLELERLARAYGPLQEENNR